MCPPVEESQDATTGYARRVTPVAVRFSAIGGCLPVALLHVSGFSWASLVCGFAGCLVGVWLGWKLTRWIEE